MEKETYLVTGGNGFIATWIIKYLLDEGHTVHATVRDANNPTKTQHLHALTEGTAGALKLFSADLLDAQAFDAPMEGVSVVLHTASPFVAGQVKDAENKLVKPAVDGTRNVLEAVNRTESVRRVVLTSSVVAIWGDNDEYLQKPNQRFDESHWNETNTAKYQPYNYSKVAAEKEAWKIAKAQNRWDMVVINPGFVLGPALTDKPSGTSQEFVMRILSGEFKSGAPGMNFGCVDVREVAQAHVLAAQKSDAEGRHILVGETAGILEMSGMIDQAYPGQYKVPKKKLPKAMIYLVGPMLGFPWRYVRHNVDFVPAVDNRKSIDKLGIAYRPLAESLKDQVAQIQKVGAMQ
ncbi:MAG: NAD-dependent epimerase/dehydratase family protein [Bacteroidota bacterium]